WCWGDAMTDILALDLATVSGWARGRAGEEPKSGSIRFASEGASHAAIAAGALRWLIDFTKPEPRPDEVVIEAQVRKPHWKSSNAANDVTTGLIFLTRAVFFERGVYKFVLVQVTSVRHFFIGGNPSRDQAKWLTTKKCRALCWDPADDNAA